MATATAVHLELATLDLANASTPDFSPPAESEDNVFLWAKTLREGFGRLYRGQHPEKVCYDAPRRRSHDPEQAAMAESIATLIYPTASDSPLSALIKYEKDRTFLRRAITAREKMLSLPVQKYVRVARQEKIARQESQTADVDQWSLTGALAKPMPVKVSEASRLAPFFKHLSSGGGFEANAEGQKTEEPFYGVQMGEWDKGMLYQDGRMDLCKMVVGPQHIGSLMESLEHNQFVRHFLLGNNIIGRTGAEKIASYLSQKPNQIETWYLAGNCIDGHSLKSLVDGWTSSLTVSNIWLKRNPLGPSSVPTLFRLITEAPYLRTLDLDQTELSDAGVAELFDSLADIDSVYLPLRHLYLNATGISLKACQSIARYLATGNCQLQSLYISNNPMGDQAAMALAKGLQYNKSLLRLFVRSCGLKSVGAIAIMDAATSHPVIMTLQLGYNYSTEDLGARYNILDDDCRYSAIRLIKTSKTLQFLDLGVTSMTMSTIVEIADAVCESPSLLLYKLESLSHKIPRPLKRQIRARLTENVKIVYGEETTYEEFEAGEQRWLISPKDVRLIDSGYRNRDMGLARRGDIVLNKWWKNENELEMVMNAEGV
ncbi:MAG: hypothetical protein Q9208_006248 [Pyrenodesmia sp. 3 TL-2023]